MSTANEPFIRLTDYAKDRPALDHIFRTTCGKQLKYEPAWTISSNLYCHPYPVLSPRTCFVLDDGRGTAVGYILGTPDTKDFAKRWIPEFLRTFPREKFDLFQQRSQDETTAHLVRQLYNPDQMESFALPGMVDRWPAHLHIDILPSHQAKGWGSKMIATLLDALAKEGCKGVHLGMERGNDLTLKFYLKLGFERYADAMARDGGEKPDVEPGALYLVKKL